MTDTTLSDMQINHLVSHGLVTHLLVLPTEDYAFAIDPKMVSTVEGITLTVVLDDGRVAVGCPGAVPQVIADLANPIDTAMGGFPRPDMTAEADLRDVLQGIARIEGQVTTLRTQAGAAEGLLSGLDDRLERLSHSSHDPQEDAILDFRPASSLRSLDQGVV